MADPTYHHKTDAKSDLIRIDYCWFQVLFAGPTDTWRPVVGFFFILFFLSQKKKIKKLFNLFCDNHVLRTPMGRTPIGGAQYPLFYFTMKLISM